LLDLVTEDMRSRRTLKLVEYRGYMFNLLSLWCLNRMSQFRVSPPGKKSLPSASPDQADPVSGLYTLSAGFPRM
jgi:hypothetical protein